MPEMLQQFELSIGSLREDRGTERLHNLLYRHSLAGQLVFGRAAPKTSAGVSSRLWPSDGYQTSPKAPIPTGCRSVYLFEVSVNASAPWDWSSKPAGDLKCRAKDLGTHKLCHLGDSLGLVKQEVVMKKRGDEGG